MAKRRLALIGGTLIVVGLVVPATAPADTGLRAELDGQPIPISDVARYHCHDGRHPLITCFHTEEEVELDIARSEARP